MFTAAQIERLIEADANAVKALIQALLERQNHEALLHPYSEHITGVGFGPNDMPFIAACVQTWEAGKELGTAQLRIARIKLKANLQSLLILQRAKPIPPAVVAQFMRERQAAEMAKIDKRCQALKASRKIEAPSNLHSSPEFAYGSW
jgi:hypothetical protein